MSFFQGRASGIKSTAIGVGRGSRWVVEKLNLKTDHHLTDENIKEMKDEELRINKGSAVRSVSSSVTGLILNTTLSVACPIFIPAAVISAVQLGVSAKNCHRVREEIKNRPKSEEKFEKHRKRHNLINVAAGATVKVGFTALGAGIIGVDHIADNFVQLAHHAGEHAANTILVQHVNESIDHIIDNLVQLARHASEHAANTILQHVGDSASNNAVNESIDHIADNLVQLAHHANEHAANTILQHVGDSASNNAVNESVGPVAQHVHDQAADFQLKHPHLFKADNAVHQALGGVGEEVAKSLQHSTGMQINDATSWHDLHQLWSYGASRAKIVAQAAAVGFVGELTQFINLLGEYLSEKLFELFEARSRHGNVPELVKRPVWRASDEKSKSRE